MENSIVLLVGTVSVRDACTINGSLFLIEEIEAERDKKL